MITQTTKQAFVIIPPNFSTMNFIEAGNFNLIWRKEEVDKIMEREKFFQDSNSQTKVLSVLVNIVYEEDNRLQINSGAQGRRDDIRGRARDLRARWAVDEGIPVPLPNVPFPNIIDNPLQMRIDPNFLNVREVEELADALDDNVEMDDGN